MLIYSTLTQFFVFFLCYLSEPISRPAAAWGEWDPRVSEELDSFLLCVVLPTAAPVTRSSGQRLEGGLLSDHDVIGKQVMHRLKTQIDLCHHTLFYELINVVIHRMGQ